MDSDKLVIVVTIALGVGVLFLAGFAGAAIKEQDFVKRMESGMTPYVSTMKTLEWREHEQSQ